MKKYRMAACVVMLLAVVMIFLPYFHVDVPKYFGKKINYTASGITLAKNGIELTESELKDAIKQVRDQIKNYDQLELVYDFLGDASGLLTHIKLYVYGGLCLPCILLIVGALLGLVIKSRIGACIALGLNAVAMLIHGLSGIAIFQKFYSMKKQVVDAFSEMENLLQEGFKFFGKAINEDSPFALAQKIDQISLQFQYGWIAFFALSLIALVYWILAVTHKEKAGETLDGSVQGRMADGSVAGNRSNIQNSAVSGGMANGLLRNDIYNMQNGAISRGVQNVPMPGEAPQVPPQANDPKTSWVGLDQIQDINNYISLYPFNPNQPRGIVRGLEGSYKNMELPAVNGKLVFGRDPKLASVVFDSHADYVSRRHCEIWFDGRYHLKDFSTNGVFIHTIKQGRYVSYSDALPKNVDHTLAVGTIIDIGNETNRFRLE